MAAVNHARLKQLFLEIVRIDSLSRRERDVALRLVRELESAGLRCRFDGAADKVRGNCGNLIAQLDATREGVAPLLLCAHMDTVVPGQGVKPVVMLIADGGYASYAALIQTSAKLAQEKPDLVQRFVDASIEGWYSYLYGDPSPGNALIKKDNAEMTDALLAYGIGKIKEFGIVDSGDAKTAGIGAMTEARWKDFFDTMVKADLYPASLDYRKAFTLQFVNKKVGMKP